MDSSDLTALLEKIRNDRGLDFSGYRMPCLTRRIDVRLRALELGSYGEYIARLNQDPAEYDKLFDAIAINVTEFFRDPPVFEYIKEKVLPAIIRRKEERGQRIIRFWSAGTAFGEEAYSLAILLYEILGPRFNDFIIKIYGTDIDNDCIVKASLGEYDPEGLKGIDPKRLSTYFRLHDGKYAVIDQLRLVTRFSKHDLVGEKPLENMDLILCRNVLIYFGQELQEELLTKYHHALNRNGFLVLGLVESLWGSRCKLFEDIDNKLRVYRKRTP